MLITLTPYTPLGTRIRFKCGHNDIRSYVNWEDLDKPSTIITATVIGHIDHRQSVCLGWDYDVHIDGVCFGWLVSYSRDRRAECTYIENVDRDFKYGWWYSKEFLVELCEEYPNQKCLECNKPSPHAKPNNINDTYLCLSCKVIKEFSV